MTNPADKYEIVMGLETHVRIKSNTKMFCSCANALELASEPNINVCPVCMGFPGMLPTVSAGVIDLAVRASHALRSTVAETSVFDRKSYFYPDLPMGYQITQLYEPIADGGEVRALIDGELRTFRIHHMHIENDAGKLVHAGGKTLVDYNRAGSPLMEIVTQPDFRSKADVLGYLEELQKLMRWCGASDADMEKGQLRCDVNISIRIKGETELRNRVELKNVNGFASIGRAIDVEFARQIEIYEAGGSIDQETRGWSDERGVSTPMRSKEDAMDYRYFPDPDLPPLTLTPEFITTREIGDLPMDRRLKYLNEYKLIEDDARILSEDLIISNFYEELVSITKDPKKSCSYITTILFALFEAHVTRLNLSDIKSETREIARVIELVNADELSSTNSKIVIEKLVFEGGKADEWVDSLSLRQTNDTGALEAIADAVIAESQTQLAEYKNGKVNLFGFFVGQCMKKSAGQGNPKIFTEILKKKLS
ncbi:Asp-tRNA(Asn)/Glu-tRNA(Gln) amidotransferase subunit GatB [Candidatus Gracilibacteria bacterium]|nr:Asp-tRNA(Asn)/Glu-tRNA(Gln) amidotransferase subunit GatB [Candidatus Gracilibacteria bacterium]